MSQPPAPDSLDLETEFTKMSQTLAIDIVKYTTFGFFSILIYAAIVATYTGGPLWVLLYIAIIISVAISLRAIWSARKTYDKGITIFCILFYLSGIVMEYNNQIYFQDPYQAFFFSCNYAVLEKVLAEGISNLRHRMIFSGVIMVMRSVILPRVYAMSYVIQFCMGLMSALVDLMRENRNKHFFYSYVNSREQLSKFKDLVVNHIPEAMIIVSQDLESNLFMNKSFSKLIGSVDLKVKSQLDQFVLKQELKTLSSINSLEIPSASLPKKTLFDFLKVVDHRFISRQSCIVTCKAETNELREVDREPELLFEVKLFSMVWDNKPSIAVILHDITEHHTILSLRIADTQKDKVLATVSHELKTPLNGILGMIQIMEKKIKESELLKFLTICKSSTNLLLSLVNSILDLNQIKAKKIRLNIDRVGVQEVLERIVSLFDYQCCQKGIYLKTNIVQGTPRFILTDKDRLSQILINLVGNAQKFTSKGGIVINVSRESEDSVRFSVEDTGIGILEEDKSKLFQIFGRISHTNEKLNRQGVGLGLTITENLVHVLNGSDEGVQEISVDSKYGKGSRFSFVIVNKKIRRHEEQKFDEEENLVTLGNTHPGSEDLADKLGHYVMQTRINNQALTHNSPNMKSQSPLYNSFASNSTSNRFSLTRSDQAIARPATCILLVDDNLFNIAVAEHLILSHGYKVKTVLSGQNAIDLVIKNSRETEKISLILMDCQMPVMDGYETTKILKKMMMDKKIPMVPIVALTANDSEGDKETCRKAGMVDHLSKPLNDAELARILKKYL